MTKPPPRTPLEAYIIANDLVQKEAAAAAGIEVTKFNRYVTGARCPDIADAVAIARWSKGAVPVEVWAEAQKCA